MFIPSCGSPAGTVVVDPDEAVVVVDAWEVVVELLELLVVVMDDVVELELVELPLLLLLLVVVVVLLLLLPPDDELPTTAKNVCVIRLFMVVLVM